MAEEELDFESLESVTHGAAVTIVGVLLQKLLLFVTNLVLARGLGVDGYGLYAFTRRLVGMVGVIANSGTGAAMMRFVPANEDDPDRRNRVLGMVVGFAAVASGLVAAALLAFAPLVNAHTLENPLFVPVLQVFAVFVPLNTFVGITGATFRALELPEYHAGIVRVGRPAAALTGAAVPLALGAGVLGVAVGFVLATATLLVASAALTAARTSLRPRGPPPRREAREFLNFVGPVVVSGIGKILRNRVDVLLVGLLLSAGAAGIYNASLFVTGFITIPLIAFNQLLPPVASRLYAADEMRKLNAVYRTVTRLVFTGALAIGLVELLYWHELLSLFGVEFLRGRWVLFAFVVGRFTHAGAGATGWLLLMTDHQYLQAVNSWGLAVLNIGLSYYLILEVGLVGAAVGTAGSLTLVNLIRLAQLRYFEGLFPYDRKFLKPIAAGAVMTAVLLGVDLVLDGTVLLVAGSVAGVAAYAAALAVLGVEPEDRQLAGALIAEYRPGDGR